MAWVNLNDVFVPRAEYESTISDLQDSVSQNVSFQSPFVSYGAGTTSGGTFKVTRVGKVVTVRGVASVKSNITLGIAQQTMGVIPAGFRPPLMVYAVMNGSGANRWLLCVEESGNVTAARYGITEYTELNAQTSSAAGAWLPFTITYLVD